MQAQSKSCRLYQLMPRSTEGNYTKKKDVIHDSQKPPSAISIAALQDVDFLPANFTNVPPPLAAERERERETETLYETRSAHANTHTIDCRAMLKLIRTLTGRVSQTQAD
jgi:hypothetical protein